MYDVSKGILNNSNLKYIDKCFYGEIDQIDRKFDVITLFHVFEHIETPIYFLNRLKNLLNDNGIIIIVMPSYEFIDYDFFILEHINFFNLRSLRLVASNLNLKMKNKKNIKYPIQQENIHIFEKNKIFKDKKNILNYSPRYDLQKNLSKYESIIKGINTFCKKSKKKFYIFPLRSMGRILTPQIKKRMKGIVDENKYFQKKKYYKKKIISFEKVPPYSVVYINLNNIIYSKKIITRINKKFKNVNFVNSEFFLNYKN